jgi:AraC-like DNA-binding protein/ligand-binding sensor protein
MRKMGLFFDDEVQRLIDSFAYCFRVKITVFSSNMEELIVGLQNPGGRFCQLVQRDLRLRYRCCRQDAIMCRRCEDKRAMLVYPCYAGLSEVVMPIRVGETSIGYAMLGQFRVRNELSAEIYKQWQNLAFKPDDISAAFLEQPFFDGTALDNMLRLFSMLVDFIVTREYVRFRRPALVENVVQYVEDHIAEPIELDQVAEEMSRSRSTISHMVKLRLGISFKQLCILKRVQRFESIVAAETDISISEAAARVGCPDPFYFSRIYRKFRLVSPSTYIKSLRESPQ